MLGFVIYVLKPQGSGKKMKTDYLSSDIISTLPQNIIEKILTHVPIRDAMRTSIVSKKWRYCWTSIPKIVLDNSILQSPSSSRPLEKYQLLNAIFHVLLLHKGPLRKLDIFVHKFEMGFEFDPIILYLSRIKFVKKLIIGFSYIYKLPPSFFSLNGLEVLTVRHCHFEPPLTFNGFSTLRKLQFESVKITTKTLQHFLSSCPLLKEVVLVGEQDRDFDGRNHLTLVEFFRCVPLIETLAISKYYMKYFATGSMPHKLPTSLVHLKSLILNVCLMEQDAISFVFCLFRSSPNLEEFLFQMHGNEKLPDRPTSLNFFDPRDYSDMNLDNLEEFVISEFSNFSVEMDFVKLIMAKSPALNEARILLSDSFSIDEEVRMLRGLIQRPIPYASPSAKLVINRPKIS